MQTRKKYGNVSQTLTRITDTFAHHGSKSHGTWMWKTRLTTPNSSFSRPPQTRIESRPGIA